jgi:excisionase family DNA binding protein
MDGRLGRGSLAPGCGNPNTMSSSTTATIADHLARTPGQPWSMSDAAAFLGVSRRHLEQLADAKTIATYKLGRRRFMTDAEVRRIASGAAS